LRGYHKHMARHEAGFGFFLVWLFSSFDGLMVLIFVAWGITAGYDEWQDRETLKICLAAGHDVETCRSLTED
jgi:hypothetical protein